MKLEQFSEPIYVTRPVLPEKNKYFRILEEIFASKWVTNMGPQHKKFEECLVDILKVPQISLFNNGMSALLVALRALDLCEGEIITTPFTFAATPHAISWNGLVPVFCDIDPHTMNLNPYHIESLITKKTKAIMPVHVFGTVCDVHAIKAISQKYNLKVIYDGAHVFGTELNGEGIGTYGDITMFSFHATKLFNSAEGGALVCKDVNIKKRIDELKNFGIISEDEVTRIGINGKMNEIQAAWGLAVLENFDSERQERKRIRSIYIEELKNINGISFLPVLPQVTAESMQYFILRIDEAKFGLSRDMLYCKLKEYNIFSRKYFYPLCSNFECYKRFPSSAPEKLPVANVAAAETLAMPFFGDLTNDNVKKICNIIKNI